MALFIYISNTCLGPTPFRKGSCLIDTFPRRQDVLNAEVVALNEQMARGELKLDEEVSRGAVAS